MFLTVDLFVALLKKEFLFIEKAWSPSGPKPTEKNPRTADA